MGITPGSRESSSSRGFPLPCSLSSCCWTGGFEDDREHEVSPGVDRHPRQGMLPCSLSNDFRGPSGPFVLARTLQSFGIRA